jgi:hypothetical protein
VVVSATQLTAAVSVKLGTSTGAHNVSVTNADGGVGLCTGCVTITPALVSSGARSSLLASLTWQREGHASGGRGSEDAKLS